MEASLKICKSCSFFVTGRRRKEEICKGEEVLEKNFVIHKISELFLFRFANEDRLDGLFHRSS